ncbi:hypothetical protein AB0O31_00385 [Kitasatospora cineracea]|uniref:hypothetical protein n=1 Tax=Kitasatospora cineracea TaxID=88074 RepID=UPI00343CAE19
MRTGTDRHDLAIAVTEADADLAARRIEHETGAPEDPAPRTPPPPPPAAAPSDLLAVMLAELGSGRRRLPPGAGSGRGTATAGWQP